jgi:hypothetical protein
VKKVTPARDQNDPTVRYLHDWRGLAALTHIDTPYQEYYVTLLCLGTLKAPLNPGNPYVGSKTQNGFCTFGGPDFGSAMAEVAARALQKVWYQKWLVHLTHRPEWGGGLVHQALTGSPLQAVPNTNVLNSQAVAQSFGKYGTYLLSQAFPEGSPAHPSYPTGHGTVAGACITVLKFFFDGNFVIPNPQMPSSDGLSLQNYTGGDAGQITVNTELNKLARNVSFGHGVGAGIHWRTDTDNSMLLGEAVALSYLIGDNAAPDEGGGWLPAHSCPFAPSWEIRDGGRATVFRRRGPVQQLRGSLSNRRLGRKLSEKPPTGSLLYFLLP